jgi:D-alanyl-D-alanine carboxypeptidase
MKDSILVKLENLKENAKVKSLLAGIWMGEEEILLTAMGESMTSIPANTDMHVRIGGVSETFLGTILMILAEQGKIGLNDKISKWLPDLLMADKVTTGMLMKNTAGYKDYVLNEDFVDYIMNNPFSYISRSDIIKYATSDGELNFTPGTSQRYSHTEFTILGEVLERATGKTMKELHEELIFKPLDLSNTGYCVNADIPYPVLHAFSSDRGIYEDVTYWNPAWTGDSGPLYSNLRDLGKWAKFFGKGELLSPPYFDSLISRPAGAVNPDLYFASGFVIANGWYVQNPSFNGYSGAFGYLPSRDLTIIIYTTQSEDPGSNAQAFKIFKEIVKIISPDQILNF